MRNKIIILGSIFLLLVVFTACFYAEDASSNGNDGEGLENGGMIITFDDGYRTDYEIVYPILEEKGLEAVSYISPIFIEKGMEEYMTWEQVKALKSAGWDIEDHTYSHPPLTELTEEEIHKELTKVDEIFKERGVEIPSHHAYPHGKYNERVEEVVFEYRKTARKVENGLNSFPLEDRTLDAIDMRLFSLGQLKGFVDKAIEQNKLVIFFTHDVQEDPLPYGLETDKFKALVDYAVDSEIKIMTLSELKNKQKEFEEQK